jgi:hypothetical protein
VRHRQVGVELGGATERPDRGLVIESEDELHPLVEIRLRFGVARGHRMVQWTQARIERRGGRGACRSVVRETGSADAEKECREGNHGNGWHVSPLPRVATLTRRKTLWLQASRIVRLSGVPSALIAAKRRRAGAGIRLRHDVGANSFDGLFAIDTAPE